MSKQIVINKGDVYYENFNRIHKSYNGKGKGKGKSSAQRLVNLTPALSNPASALPMQPIISAGSTDPLAGPSCPQFSETTLWVGNLADGVTEEMLRALFDGYDVHTISLGFGHRGFFNHWAKIEVGSKDEATQAIERLSEIELEGRELKLAAFKMQGGQGGKNRDTKMKDGLSKAQKRRAHKKAKVQQVIADLEAKLAAQVA